MTDKIQITESTKEVLEEELGEQLEEMTDEEFLKKSKKSKKTVTTMDESGKIKVRQSLNG